MKFERIDLIVGGVVLGAVVLLVGVGFWISALAANPSYPVFTHFDNVDGIATQAPVYVRGFQVGQVEEITPEVGPDGGVRFRVAMSIHRELAAGGPLQIPSNTEAFLVPPQIPIGIGWVELGIKPGGNGILKPGSVIQGTRKGAAMDQAQVMMTQLTGELAQTLAAARTLMEAAGGTAVGLNQTVASTNATLPVLLGGLDKQLVATESLTRDMQAHMGKLAPATVTGMDSLTAVLSASHHLLRQISVLADTAMPQVAGILANLDSTTVVLDEFSRQFAERPIGVLFRGVKQTKPAPTASADSARLARGGAVRAEAPASGAAAASQ